MINKKHKKINKRKIIIIVAAVLVAVMVLSLVGSLFSSLSSSNSSSSSGASQSNLLSKINALQARVNELESAQGVSKSDISKAIVSGDKIYIPSEGLEYAANEAGDYIVVGIGTCTDEVIVIPSSYDGSEVFGIGPSAFKDNKDIVEVYISHTVVQIDDYSFSGCENLEVVRFEESTGISFGDYCFDLTVRMFEVPLGCSQEFDDNLCGILGEDFRYKSNEYDTIESLREALSTMNVSADGE